LRKDLGHGLDLRSGGEAKVFWFFFSKKNILPCLLSGRPDDAADLLRYSNVLATILEAVVRTPTLALVAIGSSLALSGRLQAQVSVQRDPCASAPVYGSAINLLMSALMAQQHEQACAAERQAQWAAYNAKKKAAQDAADAAAAQKQQDAARQAQAAEAAQRQEAANAATRQRVRAAAEQSARRHREQAMAQDLRLRQQAEARRRLRYVALLKLESAPDNACRDPKLARVVLEGWSNLDAMKGEDIRAIDIEHLTTVYFHPDSMTFSCHGVFVTSKGFRIAGTVELRKNVAGDPLFMWSRDADQDLSPYDAPPPADASSPELGGQAKLGTQAPRVVPALSEKNQAPPDRL